MLRIADTFVVEAPTTLQGALDLLTRHGEAARLIAGGTDLLPNIKHGLHAPEVLVSLRRVRDLDAVELTGDTLSLGAGLTLHQVAHDPGIAGPLPSLAKAAGLVAGPQHRRMGTLGGNVCLDTRCVYINQSHFWRRSLGYCLKKDGTRCHVVEAGKRCVAAASNDTAPVLLSLGAEVELVSPRGLRTLTLDALYVNDGVKNTALAADEILTRVLIPRPSPAHRMAFEKLRVRGAIDFPMLNVGLSYTLDGGRAAELQVIFSAIAARPKRLKGLTDGALDAALVDAVAKRAFTQVRPLSNINGDLTWRREMVPVLVRRAFASAVGPR